MERKTNASTQDLEKLRELIKGIDFGMLTTINEEGNLHSRPMSTNGDVEFDGDVWFFAGRDSHKVDEIARDSRVNVSFADKDHHTYISLTGRAETLRDQEQIDRLWKPSHQAWFPEGKDDPNIVLIKVSVEKAEFWTGPSGLVAKTVAMTKALVTRKPPVDMGENRKLELAA